MRGHSSDWLWGDEEKVSELLMGCSHHTMHHRILKPIFHPCLTPKQSALKIPPQQASLGFGWWKQTHMLAENTCFVSDCLRLNKQCFLMICSEVLLLLTKKVFVFYNTFLDFFPLRYTNDICVCGLTHKNTHNVFSHDHFPTFPTN